MRPQITLSIVSHLQGELIGSLIFDLARYCGSDKIEVLLTLNLPEDLPFVLDNHPFPLKILRNACPLGFAANHNKALAEAEGEFFFVLNPDVRLSQNPYPILLPFLDNPGIGVIAPQVVNSAGSLEDSARCFPTPLEIVGKIFGRASVTHKPTAKGVSCPDWVAGMFMLFPKEVFQEMGGFDTRYFLYYEDVDLCARLALKGYRVALCQNVSVIHDAQRASHNSLFHLKLHLTSLLRFFLSPIYRQLRRRDLKELLNFCVSLTPGNLQKAGRFSRIQYEKFYSDEIFQGILNGPARNRPKPNDLSDNYSVESDEWALWMERQLSISRVFARAAYRTFRRLRNWW